ncbi:WD repeat-containing protein 5, partial [Cricetulus griseus]
MPLTTLVKALSRFKLFLPEIRQSHMLAMRNPLAVDTDTVPRVKSYRTVARRLWGDHQPLSKIPYKILKGHSHMVSSCHFCSNDTRLLSASYDCSVKLWDAEDGNLIWDFEPRPKAPVIECSITADSRRAHDNTISDCCFNFSGHFLCTCSWDKNIKVWNVHTGEFRNQGACVTLMKGHEGCVSSCCITRDSSCLISGGFDNSVAIWDVGDGYRKLSLK